MKIFIHGMSYLSMLITSQPFKLRLFRKPPHRLAKFSTTMPSMSTWNSKRSTFCQLEPSRASTFHALDTWAHLHSDTTSRYEKARRSSSFGRRLLIRASSCSANTLVIFHCVPGWEWPLLVDEPFLKEDWNLQTTALTLIYKSLSHYWTIKLN